MNTSKMFSLNLSDVQKAFIMAVLIGAALPVAVIVQSPGFNVLHANWSAIANVALTGAVTGFFGYLAKNYLSNDQGKFLGRIG